MGSNEKNEATIEKIQLITPEEFVCKALDDIGNDPEATDTVLDSKLYDLVSYTDNNDTLVTMKISCFKEGPPSDYFYLLSVIVSTDFDVEMPIEKFPEGKAEQDLIDLVRQFCEKDWVHKYKDVV